MMLECVVRKRKAVICVEDTKQYCDLNENPL